jgi:hypothetical protein
MGKTAPGGGGGGASILIAGAGGGCWIGAGARGGSVLADRVGLVGAGTTFVGSEHDLQTLSPA